MKIGDKVDFIHQNSTDGVFQGSGIIKAFILDPQGYEMVHIQTDAKVKAPENEIVDVEGSIPTPVTQQVLAIYLAGLNPNSKFIEEFEAFVATSDQIAKEVEKKNKEMVKIANDSIEAMQKKLFGDPIIIKG